MFLITKPAIFWFRVKHSTEALWLLITEVRLPVWVRKRWCIWNWLVASFEGKAGLWQLLLSWNRKNMGRCRLWVSALAASPPGNDSQAPIKTGWVSPLPEDAAVLCSDFSTRSAWSRGNLAEVDETTQGMNWTQTSERMVAIRWIFE